MPIERKNSGATSNIGNYRRISAAERNSVTVLSFAVQPVSLDISAESLRRIPPLRRSGTVDLRNRHSRAGPFVPRFIGGKCRRLGQKNRWGEEEHTTSKVGNSVLGKLRKP
jgi:hypothetical protein